MAAGSPEDRDRRQNRTILATTKTWGGSRPQSVPFHYIGADRWKAGKKVDLPSSPAEGERHPGRSMTIGTLQSAQPRPRQKDATATIWVPESRPTALKWQ
jgi:hypothetical protein